MYGPHNFFDRVRNEFAFSPEEIKGLFIAILILSLIAGFNDGSDKFELGHWLLNYVNCILIVGLAVLAREAAVRLGAIQYGQKAEFRLWGVGLGLALALAVLSNGNIPLLVYGGFVISFIPRQRIGYFRYGLSFNNMAIAAFYGCLANLLLALFFKFFLFMPNPLIQKAMLINIIMAALNMLPIPPLAGSQIFFASRTWYVFCLAVVVIASALLLAVSSPWIALLGSVVLAGLAALVWEIFVELR
jgi:Zn-dependent protease